MAEARDQAETEAVVPAVKVAVRIVIEKDLRDGAATLDQRHYVLST